MSLSRFLLTTEWRQTLPHCKKICTDAAVDLFVVKQMKGDQPDVPSGRHTMFIEEIYFRRKLTNARATGSAIVSPI